MEKFSTSEIEKELEKRNLEKRKHEQEIALRQMEERRKIQEQERIKQEHESKKKIEEETRKFLSDNSREQILELKNKEIEDLNEKLQSLELFKERVIQKQRIIDCSKCSCCDTPKHNGIYQCNCISCDICGRKMLRPSWYGSKSYLFQTNHVSCDDCLSKGKEYNDYWD